MSRFDYIQYDEIAVEQQSRVRDRFVKLEEFIAPLKEGRAKSLVLTHLEIAYMWVGKAIRDEQVERTGVSEELKQRSDN